MASSKTSQTSRRGSKRLSATPSPTKKHSDDVETPERTSPRVAKQDRPDYNETTLARRASAPSEEQPLFWPASKADDKSAKSPKLKPPVARSSLFGPDALAPLPKKVRVEVKSVTRTNQPVNWSTRKGTPPRKSAYKIAKPSVRSGKPSPAAKRATPAIGRATAPTVAVEQRKVSIAQLAASQAPVANMRRTTVRKVICDSDDEGDVRPSIEKPELESAPPQAQKKLQASKSKAPVKTSVKVPANFGERLAKHSKKSFAAKYGKKIPPPLKNNKKRSTAEADSSEPRKSPRLAAKPAWKAGGLTASDMSKVPKYKKKENRELHANSDRRG